MTARLLIATTNRGKRDEISDLLSSLELELVFPDQLAQKLEVEESGDTSAQNALLKARAYALKFALPALADDTGLEVDALDGNPGLHSARYLNVAGATDADRRRKLIANLTGKPRPWIAHFICVVALVLPTGEEYLVSGAVHGEILPKERGEGGFGYDRLFWIPEATKTMAELGMAEKNAISHRARAVQAMIPYLIEHVVNRG
jgi:XTP/dITP diphosphohydrolase